MTKAQQVHLYSTIQIADGGFRYLVIGFTSRGFILWDEALGSFELPYEQYVEGSEQRLEGTYQKPVAPLATVTKLQAAIDEHLDAAEALMDAVEDLDTESECKLNIGDIVTLNHCTEPLMTVIDLEVEDGMARLAYFKGLDLTRLRLPVEALAVRFAS